MCSLVKFNDKRRYSDMTDTDNTAYNVQIYLDEFVKTQISQFFLTRLKW